jgi:hypothetical protein
MPTNRFLNHLRTRLLGAPAPRLGTRLQSLVKLLVVVEGQHDVTFLRGISRILRADDPTLPDVRELEPTGTMAGAEIRCPLHSSPHLRSSDDSSTPLSITIPGWDCRSAVKARRQRSASLCSTNVSAPLSSGKPITSSTSTP